MHVQNFLCKRALSPISLFMVVLLFLISSSFAFQHCLVRPFIPFLNPCISCSRLLCLMLTLLSLSSLVLIVPNRSYPTVYAIVNSSESFLCTSLVRVFSKILSKSSSKVSHRLSSAGGHCIFCFLLSVEGSAAVLFFVFITLFLLHVDLNSFRR